MAVFNIGFSEGGINIPASNVEAPHVEAALEKAWLNNAATMERSEATVVGNGVSSRYLRCAGKWQLASDHAE